MLELDEQLSEFSYGYGVTREVESALNSIGVRAVPFIPSLIQEGVLGFDVKFNKPGGVLMLQFKLGQCLSRFRRRQPNDPIPLLARPFWRFKVDVSDAEGQFATLLDAEMNGAEVYYICPRFSDWQEYADAYEQSQVVDRSLTGTALAISGAPSGGSMGKSREPQIILKTDERNLVL